MKRLIVRSRCLLLVAVLAVVTAVCTGYPAHAAPSADAGRMSAVALSAPAASSTPCTFVPSLKSCQSTDSTISLDSYNFGDNSGCSYLWTINWETAAPSQASR